MVIYIDILIAVNLIINYLLLSATRKIAGSEGTKLKISLAAALGALYSLVILLPDLGLIISGALKFLVSALMVLIAFKKTTLKAYFKRLLLLYIISSAFAGLMFLFYYFFGSSFMEYQNSAVYFKISAPALVLSAGGIYLVLTLIDRFFRSSAAEREILKIRITKGERSVVLFGLRDNGNRLYDRLSELPVIVSDKKAISPLLSSEDIAFFSGDLSRLKSPYKLVPFSSVGTKGLLPAFTPEKVETYEGGKWVEARRVTVAVGGDMPPDYDCILPKNFYEGD